MNNYSNENENQTQTFQNTNENVCSLCNDKLGGMTNKARQCIKCQRKTCKRCHNKQTKFCVDCIDFQSSLAERKKIEDALAKQEDQLKKIEQELNNQMQEANNAEMRKNKYKQKLERQLAEQKKLKAQQDEELNEAKEGYNKLLSQNETLVLTLNSAQQKLFELENQSSALNKENMNLQEEANVLRAQIDSLHLRLTSEVARTHSLQAELNNFRSYSLTQTKSYQNPIINPEREKKNDSTNKNCTGCLIY